jgi:hypothetical protein
MDYFGLCYRGDIRMALLGARHITIWTVRLLEGSKMLFMVIETFKDNDMIPVYRQVQDSGRSLPEGLRYIDSWIEPSFARCFQLMETNDLRTLQAWVLGWRGTCVSFEIVPVVPSTETRQVVAPYLGQLPGTA